MIAEKLYTEEEIVDIADELNGLKEKVLLDNNQDIFLIKNFYIKAVTVELFRLFEPNIEQQQFYIEYINIIDSEGNEYTHRDDMCSMEGVASLIEYNDNYNVLHNKLNRIKP